MSGQRGEKQVDNLLDTLELTKGNREKKNKRTKKKNGNC